MTAPVLDLSPIGAMKTAQALEARRTAKIWIEALKTHEMSALVFMQQVGATDAGGFFLGYLDAALREEQYEIGALSFTLNGQAPNGVPLLMYSVLVRSKTGKPQSVILA